MNDCQDDASAVALPALTRKQQKFVAGLLSGKTQIEAYLDAYNCVGKIEGARVEASRLAAHPKVQAWIRHAQKMGADQAGLTYEGHLAELARLRELAIDATQIAAGVQAEVARGKASGLYHDSIRLQVSAVSDEELLRGLSGLLGPELTGALCKQLTGNQIEEIDLQAGSDENS